METANQSDRKKKKRRFHIEMSGVNLKVYGLITMMCYTFGMSVIQNGAIHVNQYHGDELAQALSANPDLMILSTWASLFQLIGGLAVPVFAFLLVEGFLHTASFGRYLLTMLGFAAVSEVPYDLAMSDTLLDMSSQNALFALAICLIMLYGLRMFAGRKGIARRLAQLMIVLAAVFWVSVLRCNFGLCLVLLTAVYYLLYDHKGLRILAGCVVSVMYITAPFSGYALYSYNGERGLVKCKYLFYALYPLHLLIFGVAAHVLARL